MTYAPILIGLTGDGTGNGILLALTNRLLAAAAIVVAGFFAWKLLSLYWDPTGGRGSNGQFAKGGGRDGGEHPPVAKLVLSEAVPFMLAEGLIASIWLIVNLGQNLVGGVAT
jgi:hypothetical protein